MFKRLIFRWFDWINQRKQKNHENDGQGGFNRPDLSQPNQNRGDGNAKKRALIRRILIIVSVLAVAGIIIGVVSYFASRPKDIYLSANQNEAILVLKNDQGTVETIQQGGRCDIGDIQGGVQSATLYIYDNVANYNTALSNGATTPQGASYIVDLSPANLLATYATAGGLALTMANTTTTMPVVFNVNIQENATSGTVVSFFNLVLYYSIANNPVAPGTALQNNPGANTPKSSEKKLTKSLGTTTQNNSGTTTPKNPGKKLPKSLGTTTQNNSGATTPKSPVKTNNNILITFFSSQVLNSVSVQTSNLQWLYFLFDIIPLVIFLLFFIFYFRMMRKQGMGGDSIFSIGKINTKNTKTNVRFTDVAGIAEVKEELKEIVDFIKRPQRYAAMGARIPKGLILYGPPGTGKTLIAKAVAGEANCNFFPVSGSSFEDMLVGVGAKRVRDLFQKARKDAPSIIFIDEIDSVASKRGANEMIGGASGVADQTINQLLTEMDGFTTTTNVVVIAATNRIDMLDPAILRPGRFDRQIQVTLPDIMERKAILEIHARNKNLSSKVNLQEIARRTPGFSGAQLENVLNEAALLAVRENQTVISMANLDEAIDRTIGGPQRKTKVITEEEKRQIAYHEGGHALVGLHTPGTEVVQKITIIPRGNAAGYTLQTPQEQERTIQTKEELLNQMRMTLGGRAAEEVIFGKNNITTGAANDLYKVSMIARAMVTQMGMSELGLTQYVPSEGQQPIQKLFSEETNKLIDETINRIIDQEYERAKQIIQKNRLELDLIVETLLVLETILKSQIDYIHHNLALPPEVEAAKKQGEGA